MMKIPVLIQTIFLAILPSLLPGFNISLSFEPSDSLCHVHEHEEETIALIESEDTSSINSIGKFIKDSQKEKGVYRIKTVVIDPGHGGHDPGCSGSNSREKHIALAIGKKLAASLRGQFPDLNVIMTRDSDVFIPLHKRAAIANRNNADLFISIHCNYIRGSRATWGSETYVMGLHTAEHNLDVAKRENAAILLEDDYEKNYDYDPNSPEGHILLSMFQNAYLEQSILFAKMVEDKFHNQAQRKSRGVKQAGFVVLKETAMPSVLVETGFLSNYKEEKFLKTGEGQAVIANSILSAFDDYKTMVETGNLEKERLSEPIATNDLPPYPQEKKEIKVYKTPAKKEITPKPEPKDIVRNEQPSFEKVEVYREPKIIPLRQGEPIEEIEQAKGTTPSSNNLYANNIVQFHVQLAAAPGPLDTNNQKWKSIGYLVEIVMEDDLYKYQARNFASFRQAYDAKVWLQTRGFPDAFVVAYKNGKKISLERAKQELSIRP
jgi:N-acetylmuramoyl-L-alanine amidase